MAKNYVMALDAGTTSNRAIIFDKSHSIFRNLVGSNTTPTKFIALWSPS